jgi:hypothetical protein
MRSVGLEKRLLNMPKEYKLAKSYLGKDRLNRMIKKVTDFAEKDRVEVTSILNTAKTRLESAETNLEFSEILKSIVALLKQVQDVSGTLLKAMGIMESFVLAQNRGGKKGEVENPFDGLAKLIGSSNDEEKD